MFIFPLDKIKSKCERRLTSLQREASIEKTLENDFPMCFYLFNSIFNLVFGIAAIVFQVLSILATSPLYYVASG